MYGFANAKNLGKVRKELFKTRLPKSDYKAPKRLNIVLFLNLKIKN